MRLSLCYCITEVWDKVSIPLGLSKLAARLSHGLVSKCGQRVEAHLVWAALWNCREVKGYDLCTKSTKLYF